MTKISFKVKCLIIFWSPDPHLEESHIKSVRFAAIFRLPGANGNAVKRKLSPDWPTHCCRAVLYTVQLRCDKRPFVVGLFTHCAVVGMDYMSACMS